MKKKLFGKSWRTTVAGYILAGLIAAQPFFETGAVNWWKMSIAIGIAVLGRVAADANPTIK